jgi:hypothetical protein
LLAASATTAHAARDDIEPLALEELADMRGGFVAPNGVEFDFATVLLVTIDGQAAVETRVTTTANGLASTQITAPFVEIAPDGQLVVPGIGGETTILHGVGDGRMINGVLNTSDGRDIVADTRIEIILPGFAQMQQGYTLDKLGFALTDDIRVALTRPR